MPFGPDEGHAQEHPAEFIDANAANLAVQVVLQRSDQATHQAGAANDHSSNGIQFATKA